MKISKRTMSAIMFNLVLPGTGYFYIRSYTRWPLGAFIIFATFSAAMNSPANIMSGSVDIHYLHLSPLLPGFRLEPVVVILAGILAMDTYFLAKKSEKKL